MVQTAEKTVASREPTSRRREHVSVSCRSVNPFPLLSGLFLSALAAIAFGAWRQLPSWQVVLFGVALGITTGILFRWATSSKLRLFEDALVISSAIHRKSVARESISDSNWSRKKTFHNGMLNGNRYVMDMVYETESGKQRRLKFRWWIPNGTPHSESHQLLSELNSRFTNDCSFALRSSKQR